MKPSDLARFSATTLRAYRARTTLIVLAMSLGVAAVVVLTALGDGARRYVLNQFASVGSNLLIVFPGRAETSGGFPGAVVGETPRDLTLEDAHALLRSPAVRRIAPLNVGSAAVTAGARNREAPTIGTTADFLSIRHMTMREGRFLPATEFDKSTPVVVLGNQLKRELFGAAPAVGEQIRIGDRRFRVIGTISAQGQQMGLNTDELAIVPVASAQMLFNTSSLFRILVEARSRDAVSAAKKDVLAIVKTRHEGEEDVTVITQDAVLATFDRILRALTLAVAGIAAISLAVAGILIMNVMLVAVASRAEEIGLMKALGSSAAEVRRVFFAEALLLSVLGAALGFVVGQAGSFLLREAYPDLPAYAPGWAWIAAVGTALATGILGSLLPARRAARLDPVLALARR